MSVVWGNGVNNNNYDYINVQLLKWQNFKVERKITDPALPVKHIETHYLFEVNMWVLKQKQNSKYLTHSLNIADSPQNILWRYLLNGDKDVDASMTYKALCKLLGVTDATSYLADLVTPNINKSMWVSPQDLELIGFHVAPVYLTLVDMYRIIASSPCIIHSKSTHDTVIDTPDAFMQIINHKQEAVSNHFYLQQPMSYLNLINMINQDHLDPNSFYVIKSIELCDKQKLKKNNKNDVDASEDVGGV